MTRRTAWLDGASEVSRPKVVTDKQERGCLLVRQGISETVAGVQAREMDTLTQAAVGIGHMPRHGRVTGATAQPSSSTRRRISGPTLRRSATISASAAVPAEINRASAVESAPMQAPASGSPSRIAIKAEVSTTITRAGHPRRRGRLGCARRSDRACDGLPHSDARPPSGHGDLPHRASAPPARGARQHDRDASGLSHRLPRHGVAGPSAYPSHPYDTCITDPPSHRSR